MLIPIGLAQWIDCTDLEGSSHALAAILIMVKQRFLRTLNLKP